MKSNESKKSSTSGTMPTTGTDSKVVDSQEICSIIESCAMHGVTLLKLGDLHIEFNGQAKKLAKTPVSPALPVARENQSPDTEISDDQHKKNNDEAILQNEMQLRAEQIAELLVTDPRMAEEMLENGELEDDVDDEPGDE